MSYEFTPWSSAAGDGNTKQECDQQRTERRFPHDIAQDAQWHAWLATRIDRVADVPCRLFESFGCFSEGGLRRWSGIQTLVNQGWRLMLIAHGYISRRLNSIDQAGNGSALWKFSRRVRGDNEENV
jgi:hypothetical protein